MERYVRFSEQASRLKYLFMCSVFLVLSAVPVLADANLKVSGVAWTQYQEGMTHMYKGATNFDYNPFFNTGGLIFLGGEPAENWTTNLSLGVGFGNSAMKKTLKDTSGSVVGKTDPKSLSLGMGGFLYEASISFHTSEFGLKIGKFHYSYSDYNHNMGLYLLRGPVYPGFLYSGFDEIGGLTKTGLLLSLSPNESFHWDVLTAFETDFKPYMDINLSSFLSYSVGPIEMGTGFESQRLVEFNSCVTSPKGNADVEECLGGEVPPGYVGPGADLYKGAFMVIDTTALATGGKADTTTYSLAGTKVMLRGALDLKKIMTGYVGGQKDFVFYFEAALLGIKDYPHIYEKKGERIPVLFGMNIPTYGGLDLLSLEFEYYNAPFQNDPYKLVGAYDLFSFGEGNNINYAMSPIPPSNKAGAEHLRKTQIDFDPSKDNLKWSLLAVKSIHKKITFKAQIASDHWRIPNGNLVQYEAAANPGQFYGSLKVVYSL